MSPPFFLVITATFKKVQVVSERTQYFLKSIDDMHLFFLFKSHVAVGF